MVEQHNSTPRQCQRDHSPPPPSPLVQWVRVVQYSLLVACTSVLWTLGLTLCGALRTTLLWEHSEAAMLAVVSAMATLGTQSKVREDLLMEQVETILFPLLFPPPGC